MNAVIFDVDGTLVDSVDLHAKAWQETLAHFGHPVQFQQIRSQIGKGGDQLMPVFLSKAEIESQGKAIEKFRGELFKKNYLSQVKSFPKVRELFEQLLNDKWKIALASSAKGDELKIYKEICRIDDLIDTETSSDDAEKSKPHPDIFQAAVGRLKMSPEDCMVVGDSPYDAQAATKAGIASIGFLSGGFSRAALNAAGYRTLYDGAADLLANYHQSLLYQQRPDKT